METTLSKSEIQDLILANRDKSPLELSQLYPSVTMPIFRATFVWLKRNNWEKKEPKLKNVNAKKRIKKVDEEINFVGKNKIHAREKMSKWAERSGVVGRCFSFTHRKGELEQVVLKYLPEMTFLSVDNSLDVIKEMRKTKRMLDLPLDIHHANAIDVLNKVRPNELAHAFLDFCCHIYNATLEIKRVMDNDLVQVNGTIAITINKSVRKRAKNQFGDLWANFKNIESNQTHSNSKTSDNRCSSDKANLLYLAMLMNERYTIREIFNYKGGDNDNGASMTLIIIQRLR